VQPGERGAERILADGRVNTVDLVRDHGAGVADPVDEDGPVDLAITDSQRRGVGDIGQVARLVVVRAEVGQLVVAEERFDLLLEQESRVIGGQGNPHSAPPRSKGSMRCSRSTADGTGIGVARKPASDPAPRRP